MKYFTLISTLLLAASATTAMADAPAGYYSSCEGKKQRALKSQLYSIIKSHTAIPYGTGSGSTWTAFRSTDVDESDNTWYDIYTTNRVRVSGSSGAASGMNIEHTFPKSWWGGAKNNAYRDICHLMPSNSNANSARGNDPYGEVGSESGSVVPNGTYKRGTPKSGQGGGSSRVFEPCDEYKGDLARNYFYMVTCYQDLSWSAQGLYTAKQGDYPTLQPWAIDLLLKWHRQDPVSDKERKRNDGVYKHQKNRNPFIDHPELVEHIWGNLQDVAWHDGEDPVDPPVDPPVEPGNAVLTSPVDNDFYSAGNAELGGYTEITVPVLGSGFKYSITASLQSQDADCFDIVVGSRTFKSLTVTPVDINTESGYYLKVRYTPKSFTPSNSCHTTTLVLSGKDLDAPLTVYIQGTCAEAVVLAAPVALEAENVTDSGYTARWIKSADDIDGYTLYRDIYTADGTAIDHTEEYDIEPEADSYVFTDRDPQVKEAYRLVSTKDTSVSPMSNVIVVDATSGVDSISSADSESGETYYTPDGLRIDGKPTQSGIYIVRRSGKVVKTVRF